MDKSIVRRGNHFIRLENEWCLIDGPWFDYLEFLSRGGSCPIHLLHDDIPTNWLEVGTRLVWSRPKEIEWLPKMWYPGFRNPWHGKRWASAQELHLQDRWNRWITGRRKRGYILLPDGELPEFLNRQAPKDADRDWWFDAWYWYRKPPIGRKGGRE